MVHRIAQDIVQNLGEDFILASEYVDFGQDVARHIHFVCHHNAYLAHRFLIRRGYRDLKLVHGYYSARNDDVRHSWMAFEISGSPAMILELDPRQLRARGDYESDEMPDRRLVIIVAPSLVELREPPDEYDCMLSAPDVIRRYHSGDEYARDDIPYAELESIAEQLDRYQAEQNARDG